MDKNSSRERLLSYIAGVLEGQKFDPLCNECKSYKMTAEFARDALEELEDTADEQTVKRVRNILEGLTLPDEPKAQRKIGACHLPEKRCMVKVGKHIYAKL